MCVEQTHQEILAYTPARVLLAALDVGKVVNLMCMTTAQRHVLLPVNKTSTLAHGYRFFWQRLEAALSSPTFDLVLIGHEPTGERFINLSGKK